MIDPRQPDYTFTPVHADRPGIRCAPEDPTDEPVVTVVTPFYNNARELFHQTARCVLGQTLQQWEWVIVNDAATDAEALAVLESYRRADPRIRVVDHAENRGLAASRNTGFEHARTEHVFLLDDDDLIEPTTLEKAFWFLTSYPEFGFVNGWTVGFGGQQYLWQVGFEEREAFLNENRVTALAMVRKSVHQAVGGYDEQARGGLEDWDFWLRCADAGYWGATIPEFLLWYRRRADHGQRWETLASDEKLTAFREELHRRYPKLAESGFPDVRVPGQTPFEPVRPDLPCANRLAKDTPRLLMIVPWLQLGGADKFNLDVLDQLRSRGWQTTVATSLEGDNAWLPEFSRRSEDVFVLPHFLRRRDWPVFLRYLIQSRKPEVVLTTNSELGYLLLPYLRANCPEPTYVDYCHMEEEYWKGGGYPRHAVARQPELDLNIVSSNHLKQWMVDRGADPDRIEVCHTNQDPSAWKPLPEARRRVRRRYGLDDDEPLILYVGRLCRQKKPRVFAPVMKNVAEAGVRFQALVAGYGEDEGWLRDYLTEHHLTDRVHMLGAVPNESMKELMAAGDLLFLPSLWEGIALTLFEAMSVGLAVAATDVGGQRELVTPECGVLVEPSDDETEIRTHTRILCDLLPDVARLRAMGQAGRQRIIDHFQLRHMGDCMVSAFERAAERKASEPRPRMDPQSAHEQATLAVEYMRMSGLLEHHWSHAQYAQLGGEAGERLIVLEKERERLWQELQVVQGEAAKIESLWAELQAMKAEAEKVNDLWQELQAARAEVGRLSAAWDELRSAEQVARTECERLSACWQEQKDFIDQQAARLSDLTDYAGDLERLRDEMSAEIARRDRWFEARVRRLVRGALRRLGLRQ